MQHNFCKMGVCFILKHVAIIVVKVMLLTSEQWRLLSKNIGGADINVQNFFKL